MTHEELMQRAIELSVKNVGEGGGPFGAVIARNGEIVATGVNRVTASCDPTAHAEVSAIREAARRLGTFDLVQLLTRSRNTLGMGSSVCCWAAALLLETSLISWAQFCF